MPLVVNLRHLEAHNLELKGELPAAKLDLALRDDMVRAEEPLRFDLEVQKLERSLLVRGRLRLVLHCQCVRCLKPFRRELALDEWTRLLPLEGEERVEVVNDCVDLTPSVREDILLEFPQHPLCEADCRGLPHSGSDRATKTLDPGPTAARSSAWAELDKLKF